MEDWPQAEMTAGTQICAPRLDLRSKDASRKGEEGGGRKKERKKAK